MDIKYSKNLIKVVAVAVAIAVTAVASKVGAATLTYTGSVSSTLTDWSQNIDITKFDTGLGTLTSIEIIMSGSATTSIFVQNGGEGASDGTVSTRVRWRLSDPGSFIGSSSTTKINMFLPDVDGAAYSLSSGDSVTLGNYSDIAVFSGTYTNGALAEFSTAGVGTISLLASTLTGTVLENNGGNTTAVQTTSASTDVTVVYHYDAVPEPGTYALLALGLGLGGVVYLRNRRSAVKA